MAIVDEQIAALLRRPLFLTAETKIVEGFVCGFQPDTNAPSRGVVELPF
jgi:hypothetical protein